MKARNSVGKIKFEEYKDEDLKTHYKNLKTLVNSEKYGKEKLDMLKREFKLFDKDNSGALDEKEFLWTQKAAYNSPNFRR